MGAWDSFFDDVRAHCDSHIPDYPGFFASLAELILSKMIRSVQMSKPINAETTAYIRSFLDGLAKHASATGQGMDHDECLQSLASMLNFGSAPGLLELLWQI